MLWLVCKGSIFKDEKSELIGVLPKAVHDLRMVEEEVEEGVDMIIPTEVVDTMEVEEEVQVVPEGMTVIVDMIEVIEEDMVELREGLDMIVVVNAEVTPVIVVPMIATEVILEIVVVEVELAVDMIAMTEAHVVVIPREVAMIVHMRTEVMTDPPLLLLLLEVIHHLLQKDHIQVMRILREVEGDTVIEGINDPRLVQALQEVQKVFVSSGRKVIVVLALLADILTILPLEVEEVHQPMIIVPVVDTTVTTPCLIKV